MFNGITYEIVNIALLCFGLFFVVGGIFWGLVRGFKKTTFRGIWLLVTIIILFFVTPLITKLLFKIDLSFLNIEISEGIKFTTINDLIKQLAQQNNYGELLNDFPIIYEVIQKLTGLVINVFVFVISFWLLKILLYPLWEILSAIIIKKKNKNGEKIKKHRFVGMLEGLVIGLIIGAVTLMPVFGTLQTLLKIENETVELTQNDGGIVSELADPDLINIINYVNSSDMKKIYRYTGLEATTNAMYTYLTTAKINGETVNLQREIKNAIVAYKLVTELSEFDFENLTQQQIANLLNKGEQLVDLVFNIGIITALGNEIVPYILNGITSGEEFFVKVPTTNNQDVDQIIMQGLTDLKNINFKDIRNEIKSLISIARTLNDNNILITAMNYFEGEQLYLENIKEFTSLFNESIINTITTNLFKMKTVKVFAPLGLDYASSLITSKPEFNGFELESYTIEELRDTLKGILNTTIAVINTLDLDSQFYVTKLTFENAGKLIDIIKNFKGISTANFKLVLNALEDKLNNLIEDNELYNSLPAIFVNNIKAVINNISEISNYETDFEKLGNIFEEAIEIYNSFDYIDDINLKTVGKILDNIKNTELFGGEFNNIVKNAIEYAFSQIPSEFGDLSQSIANIKNNVSKQIVYEDELALFENILDFAVNEFNQSFMENILSGNKLSRIGQLLDELKDSQLIGSEINNLIATIFEKFLTQSQAFEIEGIEDFLNQLIENIRNANKSVSFKTEFGLLAEFLSVFDQMGESYQLDMLGLALDKLNGSALVTRSMINNVVANFIDLAVGENSPIPTSVINEIKFYIADVVSFETEFNALKTFINDFTEILNSNYEDLDFEAIGLMLDNYNLNGPTPSVLISNARPQILIYLYEQLEQENDEEFLSLILLDVRENINNVTSYQNEFKQLGNLYNLLKDINSLTEQEIGQRLDEITQSVLLAKLGKYIFIEVIDEELNSVEDVRISEPLSEFKHNIEQNYDNLDFTFTQLFETIKDVIDTVFEMNNFVSVYGFNFDAQVVGEKLNSYQNNSLIGFETTKKIAQSAIMSILEELNEQYPNYEFIQENANQILTELNVSTETIDYIDLFNRLKMTV